MALTRGGAGASALAVWDEVNANKSLPQKREWGRLASEVGIQRNCMAGRCRICNSEATDAPIELREVMFGTGEKFLYERCLECGCLQIVERPADIGQFYPNRYYAYSPITFGALQTIKHRSRNLLSLFGPAWLFAGQGWWEHGEKKSLRDMGISRSMRILDLGCGNGALIVSLADMGFANVLGADPFIVQNTNYSNGVRVLKCEADDIEGQFDVVMMHHSLEHIWSQDKIAANVARLVKRGGRCLIRIPTIDCWAWEEFGTDWVALDAPRHFYLHSRTSIVRLLESVGFQVNKIVDDSSAYQILGSEKIRRGHPLLNPKNGKLDFANFLSQDIIRSASQRARVLNRAGRGDAIAVHAQRL